MTFPTLTRPSNYPAMVRASTISSNYNTVENTYQQLEAASQVELSAQTPPSQGFHQGEVDLRNGIDAGDPLTAKGRTKKRARDKETFEPDDPDRYRYKAYHIRCAFDLFGHIPTIINDGIKRRAKELVGENACNVQSDQDFETFNLIINHLDGLNEDITRLKRNPKAFRALIRKIREAADQARNNDTANLKKDIACMLTADGSSVLATMAKGKKASSKQDRGFDNDVMGKYLCPISLDWDNNYIREEIREGQHAILACDWPRLLYADCDCNLDDLECGLGRNMALVRVVKYLFTGRSAAFSDTAGGKTTRSGNAALAGMMEITPRVVAYAACMLRYAISNEESWSTIHKEFNMQEFYWHVVNIFDDSDSFGKELLAWWNMKVFGTSLETAKQPEASSATIALAVLRSQRQAKRAARVTFEDLTNRHRSSMRPAPTRGFSPESEDGVAGPTNYQSAQLSECQSRLPIAPILNQSNTNVSQVNHQADIAPSPSQDNSSHQLQTRSHHDVPGTPLPRVLSTQDHRPDRISSPSTSIFDARPGPSDCTPSGADLHARGASAESQPNNLLNYYRVHRNSSLVPHVATSSESAPYGTRTQPQAPPLHSSDIRHGGGPSHTRTVTPSQAHALQVGQSEANTAQVSRYSSTRPPPPPWLQAKAANTSSSSLGMLAAVSLSRPSASPASGNGLN